MSNNAISEVAQIIADIHRENRQPQAEFWKVGILLVGVTAAIVQPLRIWLGSYDTDHGRSRPTFLLEDRFRKYTGILVWAASLPSWRSRFYHLGPCTCIAHRGHDTRRDIRRSSLQRIVRKMRVTRGRLGLRMPE